MKCIANILIVFFLLTFSLKSLGQKQPIVLVDGVIYKNSDTLNPETILSLEVVKAGSDNIKPDSLTLIATRNKISHKELKESNLIFIKLKDPKIHMPVETYLAQKHIQITSETIVTINGNFVFDPKKAIIASTEVANVNIRTAKNIKNLDSRYTDLVFIQILYGQKEKQKQKWNTNSLQGILPEGKDSIRSNRHENIILRGVTKN